MANLEREKIFVTEKDNVKIIEIRDNLTIAEYAEDDTLNEISFNILWNNNLQAINKGIIFAFYVDGTSFNILLDGNKVTIDSRTFVEDGKLEKILKYDSLDINYDFCVLKHNKIGSTTYTKHFSENLEDESFFNLTRKEAYENMLPMTEALERTEGIENILDMTIIKEKILGVIKSKLEPTL